MASTYNKSEIMSRAWQIKKSDNVSMSDALKQAWSEAFLSNLDFCMFDVVTVKPAKKEATVTGETAVKLVNQYGRKQGAAIYRSMVDREYQGY